VAAVRLPVVSIVGGQTTESEGRSATGASDDGGPVIGHVAT
jgi:hypothetical protein